MLCDYQPAASVRCNESGRCAGAAGGNCNPFDMWSSRLYSGSDYYGGQLISGGFHYGNAFVSTYAFSVRCVLVLSIIYISQRNKYCSYKAFWHSIF